MPNNLKKTPYQGENRCFGEFRCPNCNREWKSGNSWANMGQKCESCKGTYVYPYKQTKLDGSRPVNDKNHPADKCQKCKQLGRSCNSYGKYH